MSTTITIHLDLDEAEHAEVTALAREHDTDAAGVLRMMLRERARAREFARLDYVVDDVEGHCSTPEEREHARRRLDEMQAEEAGAS